MTYRTVKKWSRRLLFLILYTTAGRITHSVLLPPDAVEVRVERCAARSSHMSVHDCQMDYNFIQGLAFPLLWPAIIIGAGSWELSTAIHDGVMSIIR